MEGDVDYPEIDVPPCIEWTAEDVGDWVSNIGFPQYKHVNVASRYAAMARTIKRNHSIFKGFSLTHTECFQKNFITGRKLVLLEARHLPKMGIINFEDIKKITAHVRKILNTSLVLHCRSISLLRREPWALYLEEHSRTGSSQKPKYPDFLKAKCIKHTDP